jgi:single-strand selective monofunctional uracil DNA glycosylase
MVPVDIASDLSRKLEELRFRPPVDCVYNPLEYACKPYREYLEKYGAGPKETLFVGMNPGPWGMAQTGVPFGEVSAVRDWMGVCAPVEKPKRLHPKRPVDGFGCRRSEVSGKRLWGWARKRFGTAENFFKRFLVLNYCPLMFIGKNGENLTPNVLPKAQRDTVTRECDLALRRYAEFYKPRTVVGIGNFAEERARTALEGLPVSIGRIIHPSPASPLANKDWEGDVEKALVRLGVRF